MPPLSHTPNGTSEIRCSRTDCCRRKSSSSPADAKTARCAARAVRQPPVSILRALFRLATPASVPAEASQFRPPESRAREHSSATNNNPGQQCSSDDRFLGVSRMAFSSEPKKISSPRSRDVERFDAHTIACQHQSPRGVRPKRRREHAAQPREALRIPLEKSAKNRLRVAV